MLPLNLSTTLRTTLVLLLLCYGTVIFTVRGVARGARDSSDFATLFSATRAWVHGANPYDHANVIHEWHAAGGDDEAIPNKRATPSVYPPTTFLVLYPWALVSWPHARVIWLVVSAGSIVFALASLLYTCSPRLPAARVLGFLGLSLALYPLSSGISKGNPGVLATSLITLSVTLAPIRREFVGGVLLALALAVKPQLAALFFVYHLVERRWCLVATATAIFLAIAIIAIARTERINAAWKTDWLANVHATTEAGGINDITGANPYRFQAINLSVLTQAITGSPPVANALAIALSVLALLALLFLYRVGDRPDRHWLFAGALAVFCLLPVYHRFYDACLLILPLYWSFFHAASPSNSATRISPAVLLILPFVVPGAVLLSNFVDTHRASSSLTAGYWWNAFVMPHQIWALVALYAYLLWRLGHTEGSPL